MNDKLTRSYLLFQLDRKPIIPDPVDHTSDVDSDAMVLVDADPKVEYDVPTIKCNIKTKTYGIKRPQKTKKIRFYRCKVCKAKFICLALLNAHYKEKHPPFTCEVCDKGFNTPSSLEQHSYLHKDLKYKCSHCGLRYPFQSALDAHMVSHLEDPQHKCKDCDKAYFNRGDLVKHMKIHLNKVYNCYLCDYKNADECNLKAHMRKHSNLKRYLCATCLKLFKYHVQLARHLPCKGEKVQDSDDNPKRENRSNSPEY